MTTHFRSASLLALLLLTAAHAAPDTALWFDKPATSFHSSLPIGNGRIGAMVFGGLDTERIVLNESSVWSGSIEDADRPDAHKALPEIRKLLLEGKNHEAEELVNKNFTCKGKGSAFAKAANAPFGSYQVLGNLHLRFAPTSGEITNYRRELDLATGQARLTYQKDGATWTRQHLVSAPDEVFASRLTTTKPGGLTFTIALDRPERFTTTASGNQDLLMTGTLNDGHGGKGVTYATRLRAITRGGTVRAEGNQLHIENADEATILLTAATDYRGFAGRNLSDPTQPPGPTSTKPQPNPSLKLPLPSAPITPSGSTASSSRSPKLLTASSPPTVASKPSPKARPIPRSPRSTSTSAATSSSARPAPAACPPTSKASGPRKSRPRGMATGTSTSTSR
jgi:hypothetical protein